MQEVKVQSENGEVFKFALDEDGNLSHDVVNAVCVGTVALKYKFNDQTWYVGVVSRQTSFIDTVRMHFDAAEKRVMLQTFKKDKIKRFKLVFSNTKLHVHGVFKSGRSHCQNY